MPYPIFKVATLETFAKNSILKDPVKVGGDEGKSKR